MSPWLIAGLLGAGAGALKYGQDKENAAAERRTNAAAMRYSGWTGMKPDRLYTPEPSLLGNITSGALTGASFGLMNWGDDGQRLNPKTGEPVTTDPVTKTDNSSVGGSGAAAASAADAPKVDASSMSLYQQDKLMNNDSSLSDLYKPGASPYNYDYPRDPAGEASWGRQPVSPWMGMGGWPPPEGPTRRAIQSPNAAQRI